MRRIRIFVEQALAPHREVELSEAAAGHLLRVLRLGVGDRCELFCGDGNDYPAQLIEANKRHCRVRIQAAQPATNESPLQLTLLQGVARGEKMDLILQKACELGVAEVRPVISARTEVRLDGERAERRHGHWLGVLRAACEQCGRARVPQLAACQPLADALVGLPATTRWVLDPNAEGRVGTLAGPVSNAALLVGPEGGLADLDLQAARSAGFTGLRLGPRILRSETAGLATIAALQARFGDLG